MAGPQAAAPARDGNRPATARQVNWPVTHPPGWLSSPHAAHASSLIRDDHRHHLNWIARIRHPRTTCTRPGVGSKQMTKRRRVSPLLFSLDEHELN